MSWRSRWASGIGSPEWTEPGKTSPRPPASARRRRAAERCLQPSCGSLIEPWYPGRSCGRGARRRRRAPGSIISPGGDLEVLHELRREALGPVGFLGQQTLLHHQLVGGFPARLGDDANAHGLGIAAVGNLKLIEALDPERDLLVAHLRIVGLDDGMGRRGIALEIAFPAFDRGP